LFYESIIQYFVFIFLPIDLFRKWEIFETKNDKIAVLLPGYTETQFIFRNLRKELRKNEIGYKVIRYKPFFGDLKKLTNDLKLEIDLLLERNRKYEIYIIGHSMGGLIGRYLLENNSYSNVCSLIMIATPHKGTIFGRFGIGKCAKQLIPNSRFLNGLSKSSISNTMNLYSQMDSLIYPRNSAIYFENNIALKDKTLHNSTVFNSETTKLIIEEIKYGKCNTTN